MSYRSSLLNKNNSLKLKHIIAQSWKIPFYRKLYRKTNLTKSFKSITDIQKYPIISRKKMFELKYDKYNTHQDIKFNISYSFYGRISNQKNQICYPLTKREYSEYVKLEKEQFVLSGVRSKDRCSVIAFSQDATIPKAQAIMSIGATYIPLDGDELDIFENIINQKISVIFTVPQFLFRFIDYIKLYKRQTSLRLIITTGVGISRKLDMFKKVKQIFNAELRETIGSTELGTFAVSCKFNPNFFHFLDKYQYIEIINPATLKPDVEGEVVITPLWKIDHPLIRFGTGDYIKLINNDHRTRSCISKYMFNGILKRLDNTLRIERFLTSLPKLYHQIELSFINQYCFDKILWRITAPPIFFLLLIQVNHSDHILLFVEKGKSNFTLRRTKRLVKIITNITNATTTIIYCFKNDLINIYPKYQDIRNIDLSKMSENTRRLLEKYETNYK